MCIRQEASPAVQTSAWVPSTLAILSVSIAVEVSAFLTAKVPPKPQHCSAPVTYHPTCHSLRLLEVGDRPLQLLRAVRGLTLVELPGAESCCGFGGTFAVKNADTSTAMLTDKMANVLSTHAEVCTAGDASCLMHIGGGLSRLRSGTRTVHLAEILSSTEQSTHPSTPTEAVSPQQATRPAVPA